MSETQWFYTDSQQEQQGPYILSQIHELIGSGQINAETLLWYEGLETWSPASHFPDVAPHLPAPAPAAVPVAQMAAPVQAAPAQAVNPYQAPLSLNAIAPVGGEYPLPAVKAASFGKYIGLFIGAIALFLIGFAIIGTTPTAPAPDFTSSGFSENMNSGNFSSPESTPPSQPESMAQPMVGIAFMALGGICYIVGIILGLIYLYRAWFILQPGGAKTTPGKAVGFLFIPLYSLYWIFVAYGSWATDWNRITSSYTNLTHAPKVNAGLFLAFPISIICACVPLLNLLALPVALVLGFICLSQMCKAVNFIASARNQQMMTQPGGGMQLY